MSDELEKEIADEMKVQWKSPPKDVRYKRSNIDWESIANTLKSNPLQWALVAEDVNPSTVTHVRYGRLKAFMPAGDFEASGQGRNETGYTKELYVRYVGVLREATASPVVETSDKVNRNDPMTRIEIVEETADLSL